MSDMKIKKQIALDMGVCHVNWRSMIDSGNIDVGKVINLFAIFSTALVNARRWLENGDEKARELAQAIFEIACPTPDGATRHDGYTPLPRGLESDGHFHHYVVNDVVRERLDNMAVMELSAENIVSAAIDMQAIARMYAEETIDSAKTGLEVVIENLKALQGLKMKSKLAAEAKLDWEKKTCHTVLAKAPKKKKLINDIFSELRESGFASVEEAAKILLAQEQKMPQPILNYCARIAGENPLFLALAQKVKRMYRDLSAIRRATEEELIFALGTNPDQQLISQVKKGVKPAYDVAFAALSNMLRSNSKDLNCLKRTAVLLYATYYDEEGKAAEGDVPRFAQDLLSEDFFASVILWLQKGVFEAPGSHLIAPDVELSAKQIFQMTRRSGSYEAFSGNYQRVSGDVGEELTYTEEALIECKGFAEGEEVDFVFGEAEADDGKKVAVAADPELDGTFIIRRNAKGKLVASKKIIGLVVERVPEGDPTQVTFISKMLIKDTAIAREELSKRLKKGAVVQLVPYNKKHGLHDAVIIDGEQVMEFSCDLGKSAQKKVNAFFGDLYGVKGKIVSAVFGAVEKEDKNGFPEYYLQAIVTLGECVKTTTVDVFKGRKMIGKEIKRKQAQAIAKANAMFGYKTQQSVAKAVADKPAKKVVNKPVTNTPSGRTGRVSTTGATETLIY